MRLGLTNMQLVHGTAVALPFPSDTFDIVVNVESSHMYPDWSAFVCSVHRVLRVGGSFVWTDIVTGGLHLTAHHVLRGYTLVRQIVWLLESIGMNVTLVNDIGVNVMFALWDNSQDDALRNLALGMEQSGEQHIAMPGTESYESYVASDSRYPFIVARKKRDDSGAQKCSDEGRDTLKKELNHRLPVLGDCKPMVQLLLQR